MIRGKLMAPCGMNCAICYAYLREKNKCPGCREVKVGEKKSIDHCKIRNCEIIKNQKIKYCYECAKFPCKNLEHLDKRYRTKYGMSEIENLKYIQENGINEFIKKEKQKWTCLECGKTICVHKKCCIMGNHEK